MISIHTLRMERDYGPLDKWEEQSQFQSTRSAWSVTLGYGQAIRFRAISIHTLRMERDVDTGRSSSAELYFNPHAPHVA